MLATQSIQASGRIYHDQGDLGDQAVQQLGLPGRESQASASSASFISLFEVPPVVAARAIFPAAAAIIAVVIVLLSFRDWGRHLSRQPQSSLRYQPKRPIERRYFNFTAQPLRSSLPLAHEPVVIGHLPLLEYLCVVQEAPSLKGRSLGQVSPSKSKLGCFDAKLCCQGRLV
jgi:hypothetical protein